MLSDNTFTDIKTLITSRAHCVRHRPLSSAVSRLENGVFSASLERRKQDSRSTSHRNCARECATRKAPTSTSTVQHITCCLVQDPGDCYANVGLLWLQILCTPDQCSCNCTRITFISMRVLQPHGYGKQRLGCVFIDIASGRNPFNRKYT